MPSTYINYSSPSLCSYRTVQKWSNWKAGSMAGHKKKSILSSLQRLGLSVCYASRSKAHTHTPVAIATDQAHFQTVEETNKQKVSDFKTEATPFRSSLLTN